VIHYHDHLVQLQQKKLQQAVVEQAVQAAQQLAQSGQPLAFPNGLFGNAPQEPAGNPAATGRRSTADTRRTCTGNRR
jgi:hypothetical protein